MKVNVFISLVVLMSACHDQEVLENQKAANSSPWTIEWQVNEMASYGTIYLNNNHEAQIIVEQPDYLFFRKPENVRFHWKETENQFTLTRLDNGFSMTYNIKERKENSYILALDDELIVKIYR